MAGDHRLFLLPSALYFSSGIHKDLFVFTMLGLFLYALYFSVQQKFTPKRVIIILSYGHLFTAYPKLCSCRIDPPGHRIHDMQ